MHSYKRYRHSYPIAVQLAHRAPSPHFDPHLNRGSLVLGMDVRRSYCLPLGSSVYANVGPVNTLPELFRLRLLVALMA